MQFQSLVTRFASAVCLMLILAPVVHGASAKAKQAAPASTDWCGRLSVSLSPTSVALCKASGLKPTGAKSLQGFPILARRFPATKTTPDGQPPIRVMLIGGIHGDELTAPAIVFKWLQLMQTPEAQQFEWIVAPLVNPDGLLAKEPTRGNARGVDLNRNFPTPNWAKEAPRYWSVQTGSDPRRFPGKSPLSEPESRWVNEEMQRFKPDVIISVHAPFGVLDFDGKAEPPSRFGRLLFSKVGVYPGSLGNYSGLHKNVPVVTIELPNALAMPPELEIKRIWQDMLDWINGHVTPQVAAPAAPASSAITTTSITPAVSAPPTASTPNSQNTPAAAPAGSAPSPETPPPAKSETPVSSAKQ